MPEDAVTQIATTDRDKRALERTQAPESPEEQRLRRRIDVLRGEVTSASAELEELRLTLQAFEARYDASIGVLIVELDQAQLVNAMLERRIDAARVSLEELRAVEETMELEFAAEQRRIDDEAREASGARMRAATLAEPPDANVARALKEQYRKLARQFHPDVAVTADQRVHNESAMKRINAAMEQHDLETLQMLEATLPARTLDMPGGSSRAKIHWATREIARLEQVLTKTIGQVAAVKATSIYELWSRCEADRGALARLERELRAELSLARMEERSLTNELERLLQPAEMQNSTIVTHA